MAKSRSAGTDLPSLMLRLSIGPMLVLHGYNKIAGKGGMAGTTRWFDALGLKPAHVHARVAAATEITAGSLMTLGAASPLPSAAFIGLMTTAARTDHKGKGFFVFKGGWEYTGVIALVAATIATLGPGRFSVDAARGHQRRGFLWGLLASAIGLAASSALMATSYKPDPPVDGTLLAGNGAASTGSTGTQPAQSGQTSG